MKLKHLVTAGAALAMASSMALPAACTAQEAVSTDAAMPPAGAVPGPALWRLADEDTTIYLFGTVHVLPSGTQWFDSRIEHALDTADELVFEIDVGQTAAMQQVVAQMAALEGEQTLRDLMQAEDRTQYEAALERFGLPVATFDRYEPWMAAMTLSVLPLMSAGYSAELGVERALDTRATDKTRGTLETVEEQIGLFDTLPMDVQLTYLDETVEAIPETAASVSEMVARWREGDAVSLAALMNDELDDPELYRRLLTDRNAHWAEWIDERMDAPGTVFVAVGAGHLAGADSVQELLEARGFEVVRIWQ